MTNQQLEVMGVTECKTCGHPDSSHAPLLLGMDRRPCLHDYCQCWDLKGKQMGTKPKMDVDEAMKFLRSQGVAGEIVEVNPDPIKKARSRSRSPKSTTPVVDPMSGSEPENYWMAIHVYTRDGEAPAQAIYAARTERQQRGPGSVVFHHAHKFGAACSATCKEQVQRT